MFIIPWVIFPFDVLVCLGTKREDILRKLKSHRYTVSKQEDEHLVMYGIGRTVMLEGGQTVLWIGGYPRVGSGTIAHEILHAVDFVLAKVGIEKGDNCDELWCYMVEYLNNEINKRI